MLDIKFIRENKDIVAAAAKKKRIQFNVEDLIALDDQRRALLLSTEKKRAEQNSASTKIAAAVSAEERNSLITSMKVVKEDLEKEEVRLKDILKEWQKSMLSVPNIPDMTVPEGNGDADNQVVKTWGQKTA